MSVKTMMDKIKKVIHDFNNPDPDEYFIFDEFIGLDTFFTHDPATEIEERLAIRCLFLDILNIHYGPMEYVTCFIDGRPVIGNYFKGSKPDDIRISTSYEF